MDDGDADKDGAKLKLQPPELYDGKRDPAVLARWVHRVRTYLTLKGVRAKWHVTWASTFLGGPALTWWLQREIRVQSGAWSWGRPPRSSEELVLHVESGGTGVPIARNELGERVQIEGAGVVAEAAGA